MTADLPTFSIDADGVGWLILGSKGNRPPVLTQAVLVALAELLDSPRMTGAKALVVASAHERVFLAGADLLWIESLPDPAAASAVAHVGLEAFRRLEALGIPVVAALHGAVAGGGLELALACTWRIASDAPETRLGLPEVGLGTIPGWGGTVRLPRLIGQGAALEHLLKARLVPSVAALESGIVDEVVAVGALRARAKAEGLRLAAAGVPTRSPPKGVSEAELATLRTKAKRLTNGLRTASLSAIDLIEQGGALRREAAYAAETSVFSWLTVGSNCKNLIHAFFLKDAAKKRTLAGWFDSTPVSPAAIGKIGVVGAGVMGSGLVHWLALHGHAVVLHDSQPDMLIMGLNVVRKLFDEGVARGRLTPDVAAACRGRVSATSTWEGFFDCDLVIEAVYENLQTKRQVFAEAARIVRSDTLLATNSSALPIEEVAAHVPYPDRTLGLHFFNPVSRMELAELVIGKDTSAETAARGLALLKGLGKSPVLCKSSPGLLVTRILFVYLNEAVRLWEQGVPTLKLDASLRSIGWPMGPLRLIDEVGLDVTAFIFGEMAHFFPDRFLGSRAVGCLLREGMTGRKNGTGVGFYRYDADGKRSNDEQTRAITGFIPSVDSDEASIVRHLMAVMVAEARRCLEEGVAHSADDIDFALISGAGFPAYRGGLFRYAEAELPLLGDRPVVSPLSL